MTSIWYHGTTEKNAAAILRCGYFNIDTWFARRFEDAVTFGGNTVFVVRVKFNSRSWQVHSANQISTDRVLKIYEVKTATTFLKGRKG